MKKMTLLTLGAALIAVPVLAAPGGDRNMGDADGNGGADRQAKRAEWKEKRAAAAGEAGEGKRGMRGHHGKRGGHHGMRGDHGMMMKADTDGDKAISQAEFETAALARFDRLDANKDGQVTAEERQAQRAAWKAKRGQRGAAPAAPASE